MHDFQSVTLTIRSLIGEWEPRLSSLSEDLITQRRNNQNRTIKQIVGHMIDSASNNTHRIVHLHYRDTPLEFPNYATYGNNDRWIAVQNYQEEDWNNLIQHWKYSNLHVAHVIENVDPLKLENQWQAGEGRLISMKEMIIGYLPHLQLHLNEIKELMRE